ncbi:hypothetical protein PILCRDRAFT_88318 [Piloderma croceum F 1598]|uniref:Uncharacterized protein n=1 Tax=Piloderma croceum (strain F 1598) TaxID=765440 RepID=A0A0C3FEZ5_PILCF|nr:hypothetical protein PILCRDRAFT_88318 [Piloderma croceum F 1598]
MSSAPNIPNSPISPSASLRSLSSDGTCINDTDIEASESETVEDSAALTLPNDEHTVEGLVRHMVDGAQRVADVDELSEAALKSFEIIAQRYAETSVSDNPIFVAIENGAKSAGKDYVETVKESVKIAVHGVAFATDVIGLCDCISKSCDADIRSFIDEMRTIAQQALDEATATNLKFRDIRRRLVQLIKEIPDDSEEQGHIGTLGLLKKASDNIGNLANGVNKFANWWSHAKIMIYQLEISTFVSYPRISSIRLEMAQKGWASVRVRYEAYNRTAFQIDTLADCYPVHNTHTSASVLSKVMAWFTRT